MVEVAQRLTGGEKLMGVSFSICNLKGQKADPQILSQICVPGAPLNVSEVVFRAGAWEELALRCSAGKSDESCRKNISWRSVEGER